MQLFIADATMCLNRFDFFFAHKTTLKVAIIFFPEVQNGPPKRICALYITVALLIHSTLFFKPKVLWFALALL